MAFRAEPELLGGLFLLAGEKALEDFGPSFS